jgi:glycosyltransferase involved in cell wall biosynthesis
MTAQPSRERREDHGNRRVCFVSQRYYPGDARLATEIQALQEAGYAVDIICMRGANQPNFSREQNVNIYRIPSMTRQRAGKIRYVAEYATFFVPCFFLMAYLQLRKRYRLVHVTNLPDALVFSALVPKLLGAKIIFDVRECTAEMFTDRFGFNMESKAMKIMVWLEQMSIRFAHAVVTCTEQMRQVLIKRGADPNKISVMLNVSDDRVFNNPILPDPATSPKGDEPFRIITHGTIIKRYGHDVLVRAMAHVVKEVPNAQLEILGRGQLKPELEALVKTLGLEKIITFSGFVPDDELIKRLRNAHCGAVPLLRNTESDLVHTYKMFEYIALGIPIVISRTSAVEAYFDDSCMSYFESGNDQDLARAIIELYKNPEKRSQLPKNALKVYEQYVPATQKASYLDTANSLIGGRERSLEFAR